MDWTSLIPADYMSALVFALGLVAGVTTGWAGGKSLFKDTIPTAVNTWGPRVIQLVATIWLGLAGAVAPILPLVIAGVVSAMAPGWLYDFVSANKNLKEVAQAKLQ
jgi:hypothetical protein